MKTPEQLWNECRTSEAFALSRQQAQRWRTVAEGLYKNSPSGYSCECFHHAKGDYHKSGEPCKPYDRWAAALAAFEQAKKEMGQG